MPNHTKAQVSQGVDNTYNNIIAIYGLRNALKIIKSVRVQLIKERKRRMKMKPSERADIEETENKDTKKKKTKVDKKSKKKKGPGMFASLCILFDKKGVNKVTYSQAKACAKEAKPDSNLSSGHFKWYKKQYKDKKKK